VFDHERHDGKDCWPSDFGKARGNNRYCETAAFCKKVIDRE